MYSRKGRYGDNKSKSQISHRKCAAHGKAEDRGVVSVTGTSGHPGERAPEEVTTELRSEGHEESASEPHGKRF